MVLRLLTLLVASVAGSSEDGVCSGTECPVKGSSLLQSSIVKLHAAMSESEEEDLTADYDYQADAMGDFESDGNSSTDELAFVERLGCAGWCKAHPKSWEVKCTFKGCKDCSSCKGGAPAPRPRPRPSSPRPRPRPRTTGAKCNSWCDRSPSSWSAKCDWKGCAGCSRCQVEMCPNICTKEIREKKDVNWDVMCRRQAGNCVDCSECVERGQPKWHINCQPACYKTQSAKWDNGKGKGRCFRENCKLCEPCQSS